MEHDAPFDPSLDLSEPRAPVSAPLRPRTQALASAVRILVIDDEPSFVSGLTHLLRRDGYTVQTSPEFSLRIWLGKPTLGRACRKTLTEGHGMPLASLVSLSRSCFVVLLTPIPFASSVGPYQIPHELVQIVGENRPRPGHLSNVPQTFRGLVESIFVRLQVPMIPSVLPRSLRPSRGRLGNAPRPVALGLESRSV